MGHGNIKRMVQVNAEGRVLTHRSIGAPDAVGPDWVEVFVPAGMNMGALGRHVPRIELDGAGSLREVPDWSRLENEAEAKSASQPSSVDQALAVLAEVVEVLGVKNKLTDKAKAFLDKVDRTRL